MSQFIPRSEHLRRKRKRERERNKAKSKDWMKVLFISVVVAVLIRMLAFEPSTVSGPSMQPTFQSGDVVIVNKLIYKLRNPRRGEIVVFHTPFQEDFIKRVVALPGETVEARNNQILINGKPLSEPYLSKDIETVNFDKQKVPPGTVFVLGDNRENSTDSRSGELGPISIQKLVGRAELIYWPLSHMGFV
jgi:signal peptidase I